MINKLRYSNGKASLLFDDGSRIPVCINEVEQSFRNPTTFTGYVLDYCAEGIYTGVKTTNPFDIQRVIFNDPATIVFWKDGTKTVVKCQDGDVYSEEVGLALCFAKKALGNQSNFNNVFKKWIPEAECDDRPIVFTLPKLAPCDQMAAQTAIKQLMAHKVPSAAEIMEEFKRALHAQRGATDEV